MRRHRRSLHPIARRPADHPVQPHQAVADRRLHQRPALAAGEVDRHLAVERVAEEPLVAGRQRGEPRVAQIERAAVGVLLIERQNPRRQAGVAFIGQFDRCERMLPVERGLIEIDAACRQFAVEERQDEALPGGDADLVGRGEGDLGGFLDRRGGFDLGGRRGRRSGRGHRHIDAAGRAALHLQHLVAARACLGLGGGGNGANRAGIRWRQDMAARFDRHQGPRHVIALVKRLAKRHRVAGE